MEIAAIRIAVGKPNRPGPVFSVALLASAALVAQVAQVAPQSNTVPLKNWATPLYWQPNQNESAAPRAAYPGKSDAQFQFSADAVSTNALTLMAITPCRLVDTRGAAAGFNGIAPFSGPSIPAVGTLTIPLQSAMEASANTEPAPCGVIPSTAQAYSFNLTVVPKAAGRVDYVSLWPAGLPQPFVATLNDPQGAIVANAAIVPAGTPLGGICLFNAGPATVDVIIDMNGYFAAPSDLDGNMAIGTGALANDTTGFSNTASGDGALQNNTAGNNNTAGGFQALYLNTTGFDNTGNGMGALQSNSSGDHNTAFGYTALLSNTIGIENTASGAAALSSNTSGSNNTASGYQALQLNTTGGANTADGNVALGDNTIGIGNTASGALALAANTSGSANTAGGAAALAFNTTGNNNIALGANAADNVSPGNSNNIHIGSQGASGDIGVIRIGTDGAQTSAFVAGISGVTASGGVEVFVNSNGQLGTLTSSGRFKEQITDMGEASNKLFQLRPVNFFYKPEYDDGSHLLQYGLIAEEVARVYPEMVAYDSAGRILTVKYQMLAPMLLNEVQKQNAELRSQVQLQHEENRKLEDRLAALEALLSVHTSGAGPPSSQ